MIGAITAGLYGTGVPPVTNSYESIATVLVGSGGQSSISFSSIPSTYKHLQIRGISRSNAFIIGVLLGLNSDRATNYSMHYLAGDGSAASSGGTTTTAPNLIGYSASSAYTSNVFSTVIVDILDYANTNKFKTMRSLSGVDNNGLGYLALFSENWRNTDAVTTITLTLQGSAEFTQYSRFSLYGIKG